MAKEYQIDGANYVFSKEKFQSLVKASIMEKRSLGEKYSASNYYADLAEAVCASDETVRKWYSKGGPSPADIALVEAIAEFAGLSKVTDLLEKKEDLNTMNIEAISNPDRELVDQVYREILNFAEQLAFDTFTEKVQSNYGDYDCWNKSKIYNALLQIHLMIDKRSLDIKTETAKKLHDIILNLTEDVMCHDTSAKWDTLCSEDYLTARSLLVNKCNWEEIYMLDEEDDEYCLKEYLKKIYPWVYEDEMDYLEIPFTYQYIYLREFAITLTNVFRNDFAEYFLYE